jgi:hypothetical protein
MGHLFASSQSRARRLTRSAGLSAPARAWARTGARMLALLLAPACAWANANDGAPAAGSAQGVAPVYRLTGYVPVVVAQSLSDDSQRPPEFFYRLPSSFVYDSLAGVDTDLGGPADHARATLRYTWLSNPGWAMKVGMTAAMEPDSAWQRMMLAATDRPRLNTMPSMHLSGEGQLSARWMFSLDAEGQRWARGQTLDMDLRVDYHLTPQFALYGSYRLTDNFGELDPTSGFPVSNSARFGVRLNF